MYYLFFYELLSNLLIYTQIRVVFLHFIIWLIRQNKLYSITNGNIIGLGIKTGIKTSYTVLSNKTQV